MRRQYEDWNPSAALLEKVTQANAILEGLAAQGYTLTLRQLYYQFVSKGLLENTHREYKNLGAAMVKARMAGLTDWDMLEDRTRNLVKWKEHDGPVESLESAAQLFNLDKWTRQPVYIEVWIEKDALAGVFRRVCGQLDVRYFACRGYPSKSEMEGAARRLKSERYGGRRRVHLLHFGDHDPSGMDMTRDIVDQMRTFGAPLTVHRLALNMDQIDEYDPPPNPAKMSDSRGPAYVEEFGYSSWELDALTPSVLEGLVRDNVLALRDADLWKEALEEEEEGQWVLNELVERFEDVREFLAV